MKILNNPSLLMRILAVYVLFSLFTGAMVVVLVEIINQQPISPSVYAILSASLGIALHALGLNQGITLTNSDTADAIKKLAAQVNQQQQGEQT